MKKGWQTVPLGEVCALNPRLTSSETRASVTEVSFVPMSAVDEVTGIIARPELRPYNQVRKGYTPFRDNDVLFAKITPCMQNGKAAVATGLHNGLGFGSTEFHVLRSKGEVLPRWVFYFVRRPQFRAAAEASFTGTAGQQRVPASFLERTQIPVPPLPEQERIVGILDEADALRQRRAQADRRTAEFIPALFHEMFGDPVINRKRWPAKKVEALCDLVRGSSPRPKSDPRYYGGKIPRLMIEDITRDGWLVTPRVDSLTEEGAKLSRPVPAGTIVMAVSANIGLSAQLAVDACVHDGFVAFKDLKTNELDSQYFGFCLKFLRATHATRTAGAIFLNITTHDVKAMQIPLPPMKLQREFAARVGEVRALETAQAQSRQRLEAVFAALLDRAFNGEL
jgi:type I restriction enzyme S subunit